MSAEVEDTASELARCIEEDRQRQARLADVSWLTENPDAMALLPRRPLRWADLKGRTPDPRAWAVTDWLPRHGPALLAGRGGIGKTLLAQTIATCLALRLDYFADTPGPLRVMLWGGEDDHDEFWRRQIDICRWAGVGIEDLEGKLIVQSYQSQDLTLAGMAFGQLMQTALMQELREQIADYRAQYVFLDSVARIYGGHESDRHQVTQFIAWLTDACGDAGVCILGHPAKAEASEFSGSTAWEASVRSRLYLGHHPPDAEPDDDTPEDPAVRFLARRKANYASTDVVKLEYSSGVLMPVSPPERPQTGHATGEFAEDIVIRAVRTLASKGIYGSDGTRGEYLPRLAKQYRLLDRCSEKQFATTMRQLILRGRLVKTEVGKYANRTARFGLKEAS